jgi:hypothetical protein
MASTVGFDKQPASRAILQQNQQWTGTGSLVFNKFSTETWQVRICSQIAGWASIDNTTGATGPLTGTMPTTAGGFGMFIPNSTVGGEYFAVTAGQTLQFSSTTTSSGSWVSITEMA